MLTDNSYLISTGEKIPLINLRTITKGIPYYAKYGFITTYENDLQPFTENKKIFQEKPILTKKN